MALTTNWVPVIITKLSMHNGRSGFRISHKIFSYGYIQHCETDNQLSLGLTPALLGRSNNADLVQYDSEITLQSIPFPPMWQFAARRDVIIGMIDELSHFFSSCRRIQFFLLSPHSSR